MGISVDYLNLGQPCHIRPTPFISINSSLLKSSADEQLGVTYTITLNGTLIADQGTPFAVDPVMNVPLPWANGETPPSAFGGPYFAFPSDSAYANSYPPAQAVSAGQKATALLMKQAIIRALFAKDGQKIEITDLNQDGPYLKFYPRVVSIDFEEGQYIDICKYTITLECDTILNSLNYIDRDASLSLIASSGTTSNGIIMNEDSLYTFSSLNIQESDIFDPNNSSINFIKDYSENWQIETDESVPESKNLPRTYRVTHTVSAVGKNHYSPSGSANNVIQITALENAKRFVKKRITPFAGIAGTIEDSITANTYPNSYDDYTGGSALDTPFTIFGDGTLNLKKYKSFNHVRSEEVNKSEGSYSVTETWLLASGEVYENFNLSVNSSNDDPFVNVSIDGEIRGLSRIPANFPDYGGAGSSGVGSNGDILTYLYDTDDRYNRTAYENALIKYYDISNSGKFGLTCPIFKRANSSVAVELNSQPLSVAVASNEAAGTINYNLSFNNRPTNIISGVLTENIVVNDTNPGDIFSIIPVIGRKAGPILQYIGGKTEYRREVSIDLLMDYTKIPYCSGRYSLMLRKPSVVEPTASQLSALLNELSPSREPNVRKYFLSAPVENWNPKTGSYSLNLSWTYEIDPSASTVGIIPEQQG